MNCSIIAYTIYDIDYRVRRYAEALVQRGHTVHVIALRRKSESRDGDLHGVKIDRIMRRDFREKGIPSYILRNLIFFLVGSVYLLFKHFRYHYKIIHIHNAPDPLVFMGLIPKLLRAKIIFDMHENVPEFFCSKFNKQDDNPFNKLLLLIEKLSTNFADWVIVAHDLLRQRIIARDKISPQKCTALLNYPNITFFTKPSPRLKRKQLKLIYPGTMSYRHGIDIAIRALALVKNDFPDVEFDIYTLWSDFGYSKFLMSLIVHLNLTGNIEILAPVEIEQLAKILPNASIGVVPKRADAFMSEAFSQKILDFMAAGVPVIASRTRIDEYYFDDSMIMFFEPEDHRDLARRIIELHNNPEKRKSLIKNAKQFVSKNNWEVKKEIYYRIINDLVG